MKNINNYILEKLVIDKDTNRYNYHPKDRDELKFLVDKLIKERGLDADLNDIDVSNVTDMREIFLYSKFNGDISNWNVSKVTDMKSMFEHSKFNQDISNWDVSNVENMKDMFIYAEFNKDISNWDVSQVLNMRFMFVNSRFNQDISKWDVNSNYTDTENMFKFSPLEKNPPKWYHE